MAHTNGLRLSLHLSHACCDVRAAILMFSPRSNPRDSMRLGSVVKNASHQATRAINVTCSITNLFALAVGHKLLDVEDTWLQAQRLQ
jgi:hypothetical protein